MRSLVTLLIATLLAVTMLLPAAAAQDAPAIPPIAWQLTAFPGVATPLEPGRYTVQFVPDGTINIRADCNWVLGTWSGGNGVLDITVTRTTVAACPADSLEEPFVQALDEATGYVLDSMALVITGPAGELRFTPALPAMA
jgi:heat shock protein HslJ